MLIEQLADNVSKLIGICQTFQKSFENTGEYLNALKELIKVRCNRADAGIQALGSRLNDLESKIQHLSDQVQALQGRQT